MRPILLSFLAAIAAFPSACATGADGRSGIRGIEWHAVAIGDTGVGGDVPVTLRLQRDRGLAGGNSGCNVWSADYVLGRGTIALDDLTSTRRACPPPLLRQEQAYFALLQEADRWVLWPDGTLTLATPAGRSIAFRRAAAEPGG